MMKKFLKGLTAFIFLPYASWACPLDEITRGLLPWNFSTAALVISQCPFMEANIIPRENGETCFSGDQDLTNAKTWKSCPQAPECTLAQQVVLEEISDLRLQLDRARCLHPADWQYQVNRLTAQLKTYKEPVCMVRFSQKPVKLVVHHSDMSPFMGPDVLQKSHIQGRDFADIGYHYVISEMSNGRWRLFEGRPNIYIGAHAGAGLNNDSLAVVIAGSYTPHGPTAADPAGDMPQPPPEALELLMSLSNKLRAEYPLERLYTHNEVKMAGSGCSTDCPAEGCSHMAYKLNERLFP